MYKGHELQDVIYADNMAQAMSPELAHKPSPDVAPRLDPRYLMRTRVPASVIIDRTMRPTSFVDSLPGRRDKK